MRTQYFFFLLLSLFSVLFPKAVFEQTINQVGAKEENRTVSLPFEYLLVKDSQQSIQEIRERHKKGDFSSGKNKSINLGISSQYLWIHFKLKGLTAGSHIIEVSNSRINQLQLFEFGKRGYIQRYMNGDFYQFKSRENLNKNFCFRTILNTDDSTDYYLFINQIGSTTRIPLIVYPERQFIKVQQAVYLFDGLTYGILTFVTLFSLFLFFSSRHLFYLYYGFYVGTGILWFFAYFGLGYEYLWSRSPWFQMFSAPFFACLNLILNLKIADTLLLSGKPRSMFINLSAFLKITFICIIVFPFIIDLRYAGYLINHIYLLIFLLTVIASMLFLISSVIFFSAKKSIIAIIYLIASLIKASGIINLALIEINWGMDLLPIEFALQIGIIVEIVLLSYVITIRYATFEKALLQSKIEIQEQAFNNISRELHDNVGQQLSLAKLNLGTLKEIHNTQDKEKIESARDLVSNSIYQIRSISKTLLGEKVSSIGIAEAIKNEAERISKLGLLSINLSFSRDHFSLDDQKEIILFRIVQEALNNIIKHAAATIVNISLDDEADHLKILIQDNGKGFKLAGESTPGIGLMNMKNRAHTIGADLFIESTPGQGTSIKILLKKPADH